MLLFSFLKHHNTVTKSWSIFWVLQCVVRIGGVGNRPLLPPSLWAGEDLADRDSSQTRCSGLGMESARSARPWGRI